MKYLIIILFLIFSFCGYSQYEKDTVLNGQYAIYKLGSTHYVELLDRDRYYDSKMSVSAADTVIYTAIGEPFPEIVKYTNKITAYAFEAGWSADTTITIGVDSVIICAYNTGAKPELKGTSEVTGWTLHSGNIYKATLASIKNYVFVDGVKVKTSRYPSSGYIQVDVVVSPTVFSASELNGIDWTGATALAHIRPWAFEGGANAKVVSSVDSTITITAQYYRNDMFAAGTQFFMFNHLSAMDGANQWAYDGTYLYLWTPTGDSPSLHTVTVSNEDYGIQGADRKNVTVRDFNINGFDVDGVFFDGKNDNIDIVNNTLTDNYACGIQIFDDTLSTNINLIGNTISGSNRDAIRFQGNNSKINHNTISEQSLIDNMSIDAFIDKFNTAVGIYAYRSNHTNIRYNNINNTGYIGIMFKGYSDTVSYNVIDSVCQTLQDGGSIYSHNVNTGSLISNNFISNSGINDGFNTVYGVYLDGTAGSIKVENNLAYNGWGYGFFSNTDNYNNHFRNNTSYVNKLGAFLSTSHKDLATGALNSAKNNVFYGTEIDEVLITIQDPEGTGVGIELDSNSYYNIANPIVVDSLTQPFTLETFQKHGQEANGVTNDSTITYFTITDSLSENYTPNGTFNANQANWVNGTWIEAAGRLDGGSIYGVQSTTNFYLQRNNFNITVSGETQFIIKFDVIAPNSNQYGKIYMGGTALDYYFKADNDRRHYEFPYTTSSNITDRLGLRTYGEVGDSVYYDNVEMYEVTTTAIDPTEKSRLLVNDTYKDKSFALTETYKDFIADTVLVSPVILPKYSHMIITKQ